MWSHRSPPQPPMCLLLCLLHFPVAEVEMWMNQSKTLAINQPPQKAFPSKTYPIERTSATNNIKFVWKRWVIVNHSSTIQAPPSPPHQNVVGKSWQWQVQVGDRKKLWSLKKCLEGEKGWRYVKLMDRIWRSSHNLIFKIKGGISHLTCNHPR